MTGHETPATLLVVDDAPATLYATSRVLRRVGYTVIEASTGLEGVRLAAERNVDLIVLDINLPDLDGYEVCRRVRAHPASAGVRVVYLSASFVDDVHKVEGYEAGADAFLTHPVEPTVLIATVKALLRTLAVERELAELLQRERLVRQEAEMANRAKDDFLATLSHELRSPLNAIIGWAEVARMHRPPPEVEHALQVIVRNANFQTQLISDLLDVSRITSGKLRLEPEAVSLADTVDAALESVRSAALEKSITVEASIDRSTGTILGDPTRLQQVVGNLLSNALKFSNPGGRIHVSLERHGRTARLSVRDEGRGLDPQSLPRIFDRFWQEDTSSRRRHSGLGLGLAIVKHLTEMHGGSVSVSSEGEGLGATFVVTLPLPATGEQPVVSPADVAESTLNGGLHGMRVLIVDDDEDGREWVRRVLTGAGAEAMDVGDVGSALRAVEEFSPHVLVSDLAMPNRDGFDLVRFLRARGYNAESLPAIALSAFADHEHKDRALGASFQTFISKPPDPRELLEAVASLGRGASRGVEAARPSPA